MSTRKLLYADCIEINKFIKIKIPFVGDVEKYEDDYYGLVTMLTAMPIDLMLQLDDAGIDFSTINEYELFLMLFPQIKMMPKKIIEMVFDDLNLDNFVYDVNKDNGNVILIDKEKNIIIDKLIYSKIANTLRFLHGLKKDSRKPGNQAAKDYLLERAKVKAKRNKNKEKESQIESLIIAMVNTEQFKYDFETVKNLSIYQFNKSVKQIIHKVEYDHRMYGVYAGTIDSKKLSQEDLSWLS